MKSSTQPKTYVLDTSVLLSDPLAMIKFQEHEVVIPLVVIVELESKRQHVELGWMARRALRTLEDFRKQHSDISKPFIVNEHGGTVRVEVNHVDTDDLPSSMGSGNDNRILAVAYNLVKCEKDVVLVTKDLPLRLKSSVVGIPAEDYRFDSVPASQWSGIEHLDVEQGVIDTLYEDGKVSLKHSFPVNTGVVLACGQQSALARVKQAGSLHVVKENSIMGVKPHSMEQTIALSLLLDDSIDIVSLGGKAGTGKTILALAAAMHAAVQQGKNQRRIVIFRPLYAVGGQQLGYLPGDENDKMAPWSAAVFDAMDVIDPSRSHLEKMKRKNALEILPITHIRGRTFSNTIIILEEAQQWERLSLLSLLTRVGKNSRVFITHDITQRDNLRVGPHDGIAAVVELLKGNSLFAHVTLTRQERSSVAQLVSNLLADDV